MVRVCSADGVVPRRCRVFLGGGSGASSTASGSTTTAASGGSSTTNPASPTTTALLDKPDPALSALPTNDLPTGVAEGSPAPEVASPSSIPQNSTSSVPVAPQFVVPATGGEPPTAVVPPASPDLKIRYIVIPHPDDEFEAWSMVANDTTHYIVFILLTRGEDSSYCDGSGISQLQADRAEQYPQPQPFTGSGTEGCAEDRVNAWAAFLDAHGGVESAIGRPGFLGQFDLDVPEGAAVPSKIDESGDRVASTKYLLWVGDKSAAFRLRLRGSRPQPQRGGARRPSRPRSAHARAARVGGGRHRRRRVLQRRVQPVDPLRAPRPQSGAGGDQGHRLRDTWPAVGTNGARRPAGRRDARGARRRSTAR